MPLKGRKQVDVGKTSLQQFCARWADGCGSGLCEKARKIVLGRGTVPCDVLLVGEAPGACLAGDTLIDTAFRDKSDYPNGVPIKSLAGKKGFKVYSLDLRGGKLALGTVSRVWLTGLRRVYRISYFWWGAEPGGLGGRHKYYGSLKVTSNHPLLLRSGEYQSIDRGLTVGSRLMPFYRRVIEGRYIVGLSSESMVKEARLLVELKIGRTLEGGEEVHHDDRNKWNDQEGNLILLAHDEHARIHGLEDNPMFDERHRQTHKEALADEGYRQGQSERMRKHLANPEARRLRSEQNRRVAHKTADTLKGRYADPVFYYQYLKSRKLRNKRTKEVFQLTEEQIERNFRKKFPGVEYPPQDNHEVYKIESLGLEPVYDMEVAGYHNFVANGVFVHNSEDVIGLPFVGPAGKLLDHIIERSVGEFSQHAAADGRPPLACAFTNLVCCIPLDDEGDKLRQPGDKDVRQCSDRLREFVSLCDHGNRLKLIVCVGAVSRDWLDEKRHSHVKLHRSVPRVTITHPAAALRANTVQRDHMVRQAVVVLTDALEEYVE